MLLLHGLKDEVISWKNSKEGVEPLLSKPNVRLVLIEDMKHNMYNKKMQQAIFDFLREITAKLKLFILYSKCNTDKSSSLNYNIKKFF